MILPMLLGISLVLALRSNYRLSSENSVLAARAKSGEDRAKTAEAKLDAIGNLPEDVWEDGEAATYMQQIFEGNLDGLPTQDEYEERFAKDLST